MVKCRTFCSKMKVKQPTMYVTRTTRRIVQFMLITLVINMGGWTFNKEAVADVWFDEQCSVVIGDGHSSSEPEGLKANVSPQSPCNHWCHAVGHFMGLLGQSASVAPEFTNEFSVQQSPTIQFSSPDSPYRPP